MTVNCVINQVIDYRTNLAEFFVTHEQGFPFCSIAGNSESCVYVLFMLSSLFLHIWQCVHINLGNGDSDNLIRSLFIKVNKYNIIKLTKFVINMTGDFS